MLLSTEGRLGEQARAGRAPSHAQETSRLSYIDAIRAPRGPTPAAAIAPHTVSPRLGPARTPRHSGNRADAGGLAARRLCARAGRELQRVRPVDFGAMLRARAPARADSGAFVEDEASLSRAPLSDIDNWQ